MECQMIYSLLERGKTLALEGVHVYKLNCIDIRASHLTFSPPVPASPLSNCSAHRIWSESSVQVGDTPNLALCFAGAGIFQLQTELQKRPLK